MFREARDVSNVGKVKLVTVDEMDKKFRHSISVKQKIFICPDCCEYVGFVYCTGKRSYFMHEKSEGTRKCELYIQKISNNQTYSPYERAGLPLYLIRREDNFSLNIGFYPINKQTLEMATANNLSLAVYTNNDYKITTKYVNEESFSSEATSFLQIDRISKEYRLKFSDEKLPAEINEKWNNEIEGLGSDGAFFKFNENGGMKIRKSEEITLKSDYYLICKYDPTRFVDEVLCDKIGEIQFSPDYWIKSVFGVYKIRFVAITKRNSCFCLERGVLLVPDSPKLNPLWPPCNKKEQLFIYENKQTARFLLKTSEQTEKHVNVHPNKQAYIKDLDKCIAIVSIQIGDDERLISVGRQNAPFAFAVTAKHQEYNAFSSQVIAEDTRGNTYAAGEHAKLAYNNQIKITTNFKGAIYIYDNDTLESIIHVKDSKWLDGIRYGKTIKVFHGLDLVFELKFRRVIKSEWKSDDESLFKELTLYVRNDMPTPVCFRYMLFKLIDYPMVSDYIRKAIKTGSVNKIAMRKVEMFVRGLGRE